MISDLTPSHVLVRRDRRPHKTPVESAKWVIAMHKRRLADPYLRDDARANLEHELELYETRLKQLES